MSGRIILMGSGETAPRMVAVHRAGMKAAGADRVVVVDSTYGFQENVAQMTDKLAQFFDTSLVAGVDVATLRSPADPASVRERFLATLRSGRYVFAGPGSPSFALRTWRDLDVGPALRAVVDTGGTVCLASAAALAAGLKTLPVYEIYKVGEDPHWLPGLGLLAAFGLPLTVVSHWNNAEGGLHDTSRCYIGRRRFEELRSQLDHGVLGIDEHTAVILDTADRTVEVVGLGSATITGVSELVVRSGESSSFDELLRVVGSPSAAVPPTAMTRVPGIDEALASGDAEVVLESLLSLETAAQDDQAARPQLRAALVALVDAAGSGLGGRRGAVAPLVELLLAERSKAREEGRYEAADRIRGGLAHLGIEVRDTSGGVEWVLTDGGPFRLPDGPG